MPVLFVGIGTLFTIATWCATSAADVDSDWHCAFLALGSSIGYGLAAYFLTEAIALMLQQPTL